MVVRRIANRCVSRRHGYWAQPSVPLYGAVTSLRVQIKVSPGYLSPQADALAAAAKTDVGDRCR
jgi:hypothetical protein